MTRHFSDNIAPFVKSELQVAHLNTLADESKKAFKHLENAHILGQESTYWHVTVHYQMLLWAFRNNEIKEILGQLIRIVGAATKTAVGLIPQGNTGGTNVSPFKTMPINERLSRIIQQAKHSN